ncbi:acetyl-coenzyme A synthetase 2-like, mitochondrial isoform X3 [Macaca fascicularis]|uniref:acetyl-coenzyme A synthetase 2-like, mitochondrial isoform X3 n=1 Tax=Macaca fascicularis TaxID=9541 RepID=UPI003D15EBD1
MAARSLGRGVGRLLGSLRGLSGQPARPLCRVSAPRRAASGPSGSAPAVAAASQPGSYPALSAQAAREPAAFWGPLARDTLLWDTPYHTVWDCDFSTGKIGWFLGGQLNVSVNCLDQHVRKSPESVALIWERDEPGTEVRITYRELLETTCRLANTLKRHGVCRGDCVAIYMPVSPLAVAAMLACARIGAVHTVIFAGFSAASLAGRINDVGEPINCEAWEWLHRVVGDSRCTLVDTWWQTETGGICIAPRPSEEGAEILPGMAMRPFFGIVPVLMDEKGSVVEGSNVSGALCISQAWPGMARTIYGDHQRFVDAYFKAYPGYYFTGDGAHRTEGGYYQITGRMDDVINISGHRLGTAEIEDAIADHPAVPESAVIGYPHDIKGEAAFAFIVVKDSAGDSDVVVQELKSMVATKIAKYAVPDEILVVKRLPKTRSGKVMRRLLRKIITSEAQELGDTTTLEDPSIITEILSAYQKCKDKQAAAK